MSFSGTFGSGGTLPANIDGTPGVLIKFQETQTGRDSIVSESSGIITVAGQEIVTGRSRVRTTQGGGWKDLLGPYTPRNSGPTVPALTTVGTSIIRLPLWQLNDLAYYQFHIPHDYALGTDIYFHVHWLPDGVVSNTVKWQVSYFYARGYGYAFPLGSPATVVSVEQAPTGQYAHMISETAAVTVPNLEPDGYILAELKRVTNGGTDNSNNIFAWNLDIHYQSIEESTANRNGPWGT